VGAERQLCAAVEEPLDDIGDTFQVRSGAEVKVGRHRPLGRPHLADRHPTPDRSAAVVATDQGEMTLDAGVAALAQESRPIVGKSANEGGQAAVVLPHTHRALARLGGERCPVSQILCGPIETVE
jgi:hypothetical protein